MRFLMPHRSIGLPRDLPYCAFQFALCHRQSQACFEQRSFGRTHLCCRLGAGQGERLILLNLTACNSRGVPPHRARAKPGNTNCPTSSRKSQGFGGDTVRSCSLLGSREPTLLCVMQSFAVSTTEVQPAQNQLFLMRHKCTLGQANVQ
jgi:hypothetical protein